MSFKLTIQRTFHFVTALLAEKIATGSKSYTTLDLFQITLLTKSFTKDQVNNQPIAALIKGQHFRQQIIRNSWRQNLRDN